MNDALHLETVSSFPDHASSRPTVAEVDLSALRHNVAQVQSLVGQSQIMGIVKANAYGHGLLRVAQELVACGVNQLGVAFVEEGMVLRQAGIKVPILVLGGIIGDQLAQFIEHDLMITASSLFKLDLIEDAAKALKKRAKIHVKIDTGMERLGVHHYSCDELLEAVTRSEYCDLCGVFSHLASSESLDASFTNLQLERFLEATDWFNQRSLEMPLRHMANSGGILQHPSTHFDLVRPGIMLYGVYPGDQMKKTVNLRPVLSFKTRVVFFKVVKAGAGVGYNGTWTAPHDTRVVTLPVGYGDGYRRSLSNKGEVLIRGEHHKIVGNVSMDQITVDIGPDGTAYNDDEVVLIGEQGEGEISVEDIARWTGTISYEVLTGINTRVPRIYKE